MTNIARNKRAKFDYFLEDEYEAGIVLYGSEVKSLRNKKASINESYVSVENNEVWLINSDISTYDNARENHEPRRKRKLLLRRREIKKLLAKQMRSGYTLVSFELYFNKRGRVKLKLFTGKGKNKSDKRNANKERDWKRNQAKILKDNN